MLRRPDGSSAALRAALRAIHLAPHVALGDGFALVMRLLAARHAEQELGSALGEVELERNEREPLLLDRLADLFDLGTVEQELALAHRVQVPAVTLLVGRDVQVDRAEGAHAHSAQALL